MRKCAALAAAAAVGVFAAAPAAHATPAPDRSSFNLTSMCKPSPVEASLRIRNQSSGEQPYTLAGPTDLAGVAPVGDTLVTVPWTSSADTWKLTIAGHSFVKAAGNNPLCVSATPSTSPTPPPSPTPTVTAEPSPDPTVTPPATDSPAPTSPAPTTASPQPTVDPGEPSESPSAEPSPDDTVPAGNNGDLPRTGAPTMVIVSAGVLAVSAGVVGVLLFRRNRTRFTV